MPRNKKKQEKSKTLGTKEDSKQEDVPANPQSLSPQSRQRYEDSIEESKDGIKL